MRKKIHMCMNVRGALMNFKARDYTGGGCPGHVIEDEAAPLDGA